MNVHQPRDLHEIRSFLGLTSYFPRYTRKVRCYLDKREFDLYTDHQAPTWIFSPGDRTSNAKLARWAMELPNLLFRVYHKPGTTMGHVDGLSRLPVERVASLAMKDLLNPVNEPPFENPPAPGVVVHEPTDPPPRLSRWMNPWTTVRRKRRKR
ncbi:RNA-dependent DNA polymerase [Phytophthora megakarya]|uniref:RNA-dependent DNA polymerase n=1 Tax=Phytophthora megakarya TaxID=4795 RepID=A0A225V9L0_9STRA|nr:RNA-dependent DNA polymerase [Phytophthora megakarya]